MCKTIIFDMPNHVNCFWYHMYYPLADIAICEIMPLRRSHIPVLSKSNFHENLFIVCPPSIAALDFGICKQKN